MAKKPRAPVLRFRGNTAAGREMISLIGHYREGIELSGGDIAATDAKAIGLYKAELEATLGAKRGIVLEAVASAREIAARAMLDDVERIRKEAKKV